MGEERYASPQSTMAQRPLIWNLLCVEMVTDRGNMEEDGGKWKREK